MVGAMFLSIVGYKAFKSYNNVESEKHSFNAKLEQQGLVYQQEITHLKNSKKAYEYKIRKLRDNYEMDFEDVDYNEEEDNEEFRLSELAKSIYPKLPDSIAKLIDKDEFQNAILKTVEKKPDIINTFVDKYLNKTADQGSDSNTTQQYKESYL